MIRTAVDTSVLLDIFAADRVFGESSLKILQQCLHEGALVACEVVWAELMPRFNSQQALLTMTEKIQLQFEGLLQNTALAAGEIFKTYRKKGGRRERMVPDFLIGAHAWIQADRLLTRDRGFYRGYFQKLNILEPTME